MEQHPFLSALGIPQLEQARSPTLKGFPPSLNTNAKSEWEQAVKDVVPTSNPMTNWGLVLKRYIQLCEMSDKFPLANTAGSFSTEDSNSEILHILRQARIDFVRFIQKNDFFHDIKIRSTHRKVQLHDSGFVLSVWALVRITDPKFKQWLGHLKFPGHAGNQMIPRDANNRYTVDVSPHLKVYVENDAPGLPERWVVGYEITVPAIPHLEDVTFPSQEQLEQFILDSMWMPLLRSMRFKKWEHRLI